MSNIKELANKAKANITELTEILDTSDTLGEGKRKPKAQTKATQKWQEKAGLMSKSYKLKSETVQAFAEACEANGKPQSEVLASLMSAYINGDSSKSCFLCKLFPKLRKR
jgi:hypothetical protein